MNLPRAASKSLRFGHQRQTNVLMFPFQEADHAADMVSRAILDSRTPEDLKHSQSVVEDAQLPLEQKKRKIQRNLRTLEQTGHVSSKNKYQDILNAMAKVVGKNILSSFAYQIDANRWSHPGTL